MRAAAAVSGGAGPDAGVDVIAEVRSLVLDALRELVAGGELDAAAGREELLALVNLEPPRAPEHGDMTTNACLVTAKAAKKAPRDVAALLVPRLEKDGRVESAEVAGPGFVNLRLGRGVWTRAVDAALGEGPAYGRSALGGGGRVNVEYVSANPTGPLHVGHGRGAVVGDAIASLLAFAGYEVTREYYVNDAGAQVDALARSLHTRYREALGGAEPAPETLDYPGDYLVPPAEAMAGEHGARYADAPEEEWLPVFRDAGIEAMMRLVKNDLHLLDIKHDVFISERELRDAGRVGEATEELEERNLLYTGTLEKPKGHDDGEWEPRPQLLFRATEFGDDSDRPLQRGSGEWTYFAGDLAYHRDKWQRGFAEQVNVWGADHGGYVKRVQAGLEALSGGDAHLSVILCQLVRITRDGKPVRMSKRKGDMVPLADVVGEVGPGVFRFLVLTRRPDAPFDFDLAEAVRKSKDNPVYYVQYAHARIRSAFRRAADEEALRDLDTAKADLDRLEDPREEELMRRVALWPRAVEAAARAREPHRIAYHLHELASVFHRLWTAGSRKEPALRILVPEDPELTCARLALAEAVRTVLACGLKLLGVEPAEELR